MWAAMIAMADALCMIVGGLDSPPFVIAGLAPAIPIRDARP
jgi:hypothetical protein